MRIPKQAESVSRGTSVRQHTERDGIVPQLTYVCPCPCGGPAVPQGSSGCCCGYTLQCNEDGAVLTDPAC